jgi:hypothetical protein
VKALTASAVVWRILCALIALGLMLTPLQMVQPASAMPTMAMEDGDCMKPPTYCEQDNNDCSQMPGCFAKCSGFATPATFLPFVLSMLTNLQGEGLALALEPHATSPPRRPPRI